MRISLARLRVAVDPNIIDYIVAQARNNARSLLTTSALTDNSTGTVGSGIVPIPTVDGKLAQSGTNLASRSGFNTAMTSVNNAVAVLAAFFNTNVFAKFDTPQLAGATGAVATAGTIPAIPKTVTGVDGTGGDAMLRSEASAAITRARNNVAHIVKAYNIAATALGVPTLNDTTNGKASLTMNVYALVTAPTAVAAGNVSSSDLASKAGVDAALTAIANDVAYLANRVNTILLAAATLNARIPAIVVP